MKKNLVNIFATTGISLLFLSIIALCLQARVLYLQTVLQVFGANVIIHAGLYIMRRAEVKNAVLEIFLDVILIMIMLYVFGVVFHWFTSTPVWLLFVMDILIYIVSSGLDLLYVKQEVREINMLIGKRDNKKI